MRMTGRWIRRGSTVIVLGVDRELDDEAALAFEAGTPSRRPALRQGASGAAVRELQALLKSGGFDPGPIDGRFGSGTDAAVKAFQRARGLAADGIVGAQTWAALDAGSQQPWSPPPPRGSPAPVPSAPRGGSDPAIEALNLSEPARSAAYHIKNRHPWVVFTSGRRDAPRQASAMAGNVLKNRRWIEQTYASNPVSRAAQAWVDAHPEARTQQAITAGLLGVFNQFSSRDLGRLSVHLSGLAFDVRPEPSQAAAFWATVRSLPGVRQRFDKEGGLTIWHIGF